jgi:hypothetical protein
MNIYNSGKVEWTMGDIERMQNRIAELEREKAELMAQVECVKSHFNELIEVAQRCDSWESFPQQPSDRAVAALESLPAQCLNQIKAEAGRVGYRLGAEQWCFNQNEMQADIERAADQYANRIAKGE